MMEGNRRSFLKKAGILAGGAIAAPALLSQEQLFAKGTGKKVKTVVLCITGGGLRNRETVHMQEGNLMPQTLGAGGLQQYGTLYRNFIYANGPTGHFNAHTALLTGMYTKTDLDIKSKPDYPTLFEYYRKHSGMADAWWVSNVLGPYPSLNHGQDWNYGAAYAAGYVQPVEKKHSSNDVNTILHASAILEKEQPSLLVVNLQDADIAHSNYSSYCKSIQQADQALALLWANIQAIPALRDNTVLIALPEHGRNEKGNSIVDENGREGLDHTGDASSREIFCLVLGPDQVIKQNHVIEKQEGQSTDVLPTIASLLGFYELIPSTYRKKIGQPLYASFV